MKKARKTKRLTHSAVSIAMSAAMCTSGILGSLVPVVSVAGATEDDLARGQDVVVMADCPVVREDTVKNNPCGSHLKLNDGDDATGWTSGSNESVKHTEHWAYIDFGSSMTFDEVRLFWDSNAYAADYRIQVSNSGRDSDWYDRAVITGNESGGEKIHDFEQTTARYVRVYVDQAKQENAAVTLNTISVFQKTEELSGEEAVEKDAAWLTEDEIKSAADLYPEITNPDLQNVKASLNLPKTGFNSSTISWSVSPDDGGINTDNGEVLRGEEDKQYQLTAAISKDGVSETKTFDVTVKANVVLGAELVKEGGRSYLTAGGEPLPYINIQNCGMQQYCTLDKTLEEKLAMEENLFEKTAQLGYKRIGIIFKWKDFEPTNAGEYDWRIVDKYIEWCNKYDLYWDIVWFGSNSCGGSRLVDGGSGISGGEVWMGNLPTYVDHFTGYFDNGVHSGAPMVKSPVLKGPNYEYIKANEIRAVQDLMDHIAKVDTNRRTACFQVMNEPYWHEMSRPYWQNNWSKNNEGEDRWVYDWISDMAVAIKASDYSVPTRINGSFGAYNPDQYNWLEALPGIDFMGDDSYNANVSVIKDNIVNKLGGTSFPHIAENDGSYGNTSSLMLTAIVNGGGYHGWQLSRHANNQSMADDNYYNWELGKPAVWRESGQDMGRINPAINRISRLVAVAPVDSMAGFNIDQNTPLASYQNMQTIQGIYAGYECDDASVAMAVKKDKAVYLVSDSASDGNGTVNFITYQEPVSASYGEMNEKDEWVVSEELTPVKGEDGIYRVPVKSGECVRVEFKDVALAQLTDLTVNAGKLTPEFSPSVHEYSLDVDTDVSEIRLSAELEGEDASFYANGVTYASGSTTLPIPLQFGANDITMHVVWDSVGAVADNTYTIHVNRNIGDEITAARIAESVQNAPEYNGEGTLTMPQVPDGYSICIETSDKEDVIAKDGTVTLPSLDQVVRVSFRVTKDSDPEDTGVSRKLPVKIDAKSDTPQNINLALKKSVIDMTAGETGEVGVNAVDGNYLTRYVSSASIQGGPGYFTVDLGSVMEFNQMVTHWDAARVGEYALWVSDDNKTWTEVIPRKTLDHAGQQIDNFDMVSGRYVKFGALKNGPGAGVFAIVELELYNKKLISEDTVLRGLELSAGTLSPEFNTDTKSYTAVVGSETDAVTVTPKQNGADAVVKINGETVKNGEESKPITLETGENVITVYVQDPVNEDCTDTYEITITKKGYSTEEYQNVLLKKPVTTPNGGGFWHSPSNVNDGNKESFSQPSGSMADYQFDLQGTYRIDQFQMTTSAANVPVNFDVKTSLDGKNWTTVASVVGYKPTSVTLDFEPVNARYLLVDILSGSSIAAINEVEAFGVPVEYNAKAVAGNIHTLSVEVGDTQLKLPAVPSPYTVQIKTSSNPDVIALDGIITASDEYQYVDVVLEVADGEDRAETETIRVTVPPKSLTCANVAEDLYRQIMEMISPTVPKDVTRLELPTPPAGFNVAYHYVEGDQTLLSFNGNTVTINPQRNSAGANYSLTVSRGGESAGSEGWLVFNVPGRSATAQEMIDELKFETTQKSGNLLKLPEMPEGYKLEIVSSSNQSVINLVGNMPEIESTTKVDLYLKVTKTDDGTTAYRTVKFTVQSSADFKALENLVKQYEELYTQEDLYEAESFRNFLEAMLEATRVLGEESSSQAQIDDAAAAVQEAVDSLVKKAEPEELPYEDVKDTDWFYEDVCTMYEKGLMTGVDAETFAPALNLTRDQFAVILWRAEGSPKMDYEEKFADVAEGQWYTDAVLWANEKGIATGYADSKLFGPADPISREQAAVMLYRYAEYKGYDVTEKAELDDVYDDADAIQGYAKDAMAWAVGAGIIKGKDGQKILAPQGNTNRAESAAVISRFVQKYEK